MNTNFVLIVGYVFIWVSTAICAVALLIVAIELCWRLYKILNGLPKVMRGYKQYLEDFKARQEKEAKP